MLSDDASHIFLIKIKKSGTVGALRGSIKGEKRPTFDHVPSNTLILWKIDIPVDQGIAERIKQEDYVDEHRLLPLNKLSKVFLAQPNDEHLYIIVKRPTGTCYYAFFLFSFLIGASLGADEEADTLSHL